MTDIVQSQDDSLSKITSDLRGLSLQIAKMEASNPMKIQEKINNIIGKIPSLISRVESIVNMAFLHCLSPGAIGKENIEKMYNGCRQLARERGVVLLIDNVSGLFQLETSFLYDSLSMEITLIVHIPFVHHDDRLQLLKYTPFPLTDVLVDGYSIIPDVGGRSLLAVGKNKKLHKVLEFSDLAGCQKRGSTFLCEDRNILRTDLENTCLGSLYLRDGQASKRLCKFIISNETEYVFPMNVDRWIIVTPSEFTTDAQCNGVNRSVIIRPLTLLHMGRDCRISLKQHSLVTDYNLDYPNSILYESWGLESKVFFPDMSPEGIKNAIRRMKHRQEISIFKARQFADDLKIDYENSWMFNPFFKFGFIIMAVTVSAVIFYFCSKCVNHLIRTFLVNRSTERTQESLQDILKNINPTHSRNSEQNIYPKLKSHNEYEKQAPSFLMTENEQLYPLLGSSAPLVPCKFKKIDLFDASEFNCTDHDPKNGCAGFWEKLP